jgi:glycosyltransferase involved in cell wall biosynthesis
MNNNPKISIAIPAYEYSGNGWYFLSYLLNSIIEQDYKNYEVVVSDQSSNDSIKEVCNIYSKIMNIHHVPFDLKGMGKNFNNAVDHCSGSLIKVMCADDYFVDHRALTKIVQSFDDDSNFWLLNGCVHSQVMNNFYERMIPYYQDKIHLGANTISSPSVLTMRGKFFFDDSLVMLLDCEMYKRLYKVHGNPMIIQDPLICNRMHKDQAQKNQNDVLQKEIEYCRKLYDE